MHDTLRYLVIACAFTCAACAPRTSPTPPAPPPAAQRSAPPPLPVPNEPVRRTGLHPDLFRDAYDLQPTPTATPTEVAKAPTAGLANEDGFQEPRDRGQVVEQPTSPQR